MTDFNAIKEALVGIDEDKTVQLVNAAVAEHVPAKDILNQGLIAGMDIVGDKMESADMFIPEVLMAAKVMGSALDILKPLLGDAASAGKGKVVIGTVKGDLHDIGKNLVVMMLESAGFEVDNLGTDVEPEKFVEAVKEDHPQLLCLSALLTTTMPMMKKTIDAIEELGLRDQLKIMVGGAPVTEDFAKKIGADGYAPDAGSATRMAKEFTASEGEL